jgi:hypothetical protein
VTFVTTSEVAIQIQIPDVSALLMIGPANKIGRRGLAPANERSVKALPTTPLGIGSFTGAAGGEGGFGGFGGKMSGGVMIGNVSKTQVRLSGQLYLT